MDAPFHGGSNDTIGGRVQPRPPEILLSFLATQSTNFVEKTDLCHHNSLSPVK
jgi:hypothetical protein